MSTLAAPAPKIEEAVTAATYAQWRQAVQAELQGAPFDKKLLSRTFEGLALQPLYTSAHAALPERTTPGEVVFLRGTCRENYSKRPWTICQEWDVSTPEDFNLAARQALARGEETLAVRLDRAGRIGFDPDETAGAGEGDEISLVDGEDLRRAFEKIALADVRVEIDAGASALPFAAIFLTHARAKRASWKQLRGSLVADPLAEWTVRGDLPISLEALLGDLAGWTHWADQNASGLATIGVSGAHWLEAGGHAVQELALTIAAGAEYLRELAARGVPPELASRHMRFRFAVGPQFFTELAKFRAFRALWGRVLKGFQADPADAWPRVHAVTARWNQTKLDPHVNLLRVTTEALSAVLGGVDSLGVGAFDETAGGSDEFSRRIAANVHTLLAEEFRLLSPRDPAGGSWYVETLTDELARQAWTLFQDVERDGGFVKSFLEGRPQKLIAATAAEKIEAVNKRRLGLVGTNVFPNLKERAPAPRDDTPAASRAAEIAARRPRPKKTSLPVRWPARLKEAMGAAQAGATLGQLTKRAYGAAPSGAPSVAPIAAWRAAQGFEALRAAADSYAAKKGKRPQVFLAKMGPTAQHKARADFAAGFFSTGGFETLAKQTFETPESAALAFVNSGAPIAVLCSTDGTYPALAPVFARAVKAAAPAALVVLAGLPDAEQAAAFRAAGFDEFIHLRADTHATLAQFFAKIGATLPTSS